MTPPDTLPVVLRTIADVLDSNLAKAYKLREFSDEALKAAIEWTVEDLRERATAAPVSPAEGVERHEPSCPRVVYGPSFLCRCEEIRKRTSPTTGDTRSERAEDGAPGSRSDGGSLTASSTVPAGEGKPHSWRESELGGWRCLHCGFRTQDLFPPELGCDRPETEPPSTTAPILDEDPDCRVCGKPHIEHKRVCQTPEQRVHEIALILSGKIDEEARWNLEDERAALLKKIASPAPTDHSQAMKFYGVTTVDELIAVMAKQIERLQEKNPIREPIFSASPRHG